MVDAKMSLLKTTELFFTVKWLEKNKLTRIQSFQNIKI